MAAAPSYHPKLHAPHGGEYGGSTVVGEGGDRETVDTISDGAQKITI